MKKYVFALFALCVALESVPSAQAAGADLEINTPAITSLRTGMRARFHEQLSALYDSGAIGLARDGLIAVRDANAVPLAQRQNVNSLVAAQNNDLNALYKEIAAANGHPEWEAEVRNTFAQRWIQRAHPGWWYQDESGSWQKK
jgi:uncharacterized protein YdbL (DUF1318 family)